MVVQGVEGFVDGTPDVLRSSGGEDVAWMDVAEEGDPVAGPLFHFRQCMLNAEIQKVDADFRQQRSARLAGGVVVEELDGDVRAEGFF